MRSRYKQPKPKFLNGTTVKDVATFLRRGQPSPFRFEALIRHGLRVYLIFRGVSWHDADRDAALVLLLAFARMRVPRPTWLEGQREFTRVAGRTYCANEECQKLIERDSLQTLMYCSEECRLAEKNKRSYEEHRDERVEYAAAQRVIKRANGECRFCEWCGREFKALDYSGKKPQRFCGLECRSAFARSCPNSWQSNRPRFRSQANGRFVSDGAVMPANAERKPKLEVVGYAGQDAPPTKPASIIGASSKVVPPGVTLPKHDDKPRNYVWPRHARGDPKP